MKKKTVLFIEDDSDDINFVLNAVKENQFFMNYLILAYNGKEALDYLKLNKNENVDNIKYYPDLIILDLKLPLVDGLGVLKRIKTNINTKNIPVVVFTSSEDIKELKESYELGVNSFVRKPVIYADFINTSKKLIDYWLEINITPPV